MDQPRHWSATTDYGRAAEALALRVGHAAELREDDVVVDYACGFGDSLRLWIERFGVRRVVGVEPDPDVCATLRARVAAWGLGERVRIVAARAEALTARDADPEASAVVCVDAAYHFRPRLAWWRALAASLPRGARVAATDLVLADGRRAGPLLRAVARAMRIPPENLADAATLQRELQACGFVNVAQQDLGAAVLDGFVERVPAHGLALRLTRTSLRVLRRRPLVGYTLLTARAPG